MQELEAVCPCEHLFRFFIWSNPVFSQILNSKNQNFSRKILAVPIVDGIKWENIEHLGYSQDTTSVGIFEWGFLYKEMTISKEDLAAKPRPTSPTKYKSQNSVSHLSTFF